MTLESRISSNHFHKQVCKVIKTQFKFRDMLRLVSENINAYTALELASVDAAVPLLQQVFRRPLNAMARFEEPWKEILGQGKRFESGKMCTDFYKLVLKICRNLDKFCNNLRSVSENRNLYTATELAIFEIACRVVDRDLSQILDAVARFEKSRRRDFERGERKVTG